MKQNPTNFQNVKRHTVMRIPPKAKTCTFASIAAVTTLATIAALYAQRPGGRPGGGGGRVHLETKAQSRELVPADQEPPFENKVSIEEKDGFRVITANNIPKHLIGTFPNPGNPNTPTEQKVELKIPLEPKANDEPTPAIKAVGIALNGVFFEAGTGESWTGGKTRTQGPPAWGYEALGGALDFGLDQNHAHVQPGGKYHYHGQPTGLLKKLNYSHHHHSPLIGWAFDGFPIYNLYGYSDPEDPNSEVVEMTSSFKLKEGERPGAPDGPGGKYDGAFIADYEYVEGAGTLDECNGRFTKTPEFPDGTYAYFLTQEWPVIYRNYRGTPTPLRPGAERGPGGRNERGRPGGGRGPGGAPPNETPESTEE